MILGINTAQQMHEIALLDAGEILLEKRWLDQRDDVERLVPTLASMLEELGLEKSEITDILVIHGPGSFTSLRAGVTFANALAEGLGAKLHSLDTFELLELKAASVDPVLAVLLAGGQDVGIKVKDQIKVGPIAALLAPFEHHKYKVIAEVRETQADELHSICLEKGWHKVEGHERLTLGEVLLSHELGEPQNLVEPLYMRGPHITKTSNPWKK